MLRTVTRSEITDRGQHCICRECGPDLPENLQLRGFRSRTGKIKHFFGNGSTGLIGAASLFVTTDAALCQLPLKSASIPCCAILVRELSSEVDRDDQEQGSANDTAFSAAGIFHHVLVKYSTRS